MSENQVVEQFWDDYYQYSGERQTDLALNNLLKNFRRIVDADSRTANAIDKHLPLRELIFRAKEENYLEFAETVTFANKHLN